MGGKTGEAGRERERGVGRKDWRDRERERGREVVRQMTGEAGREREIGVGRKDW